MPERIHVPIPQVGAPDLELRNSPIVEEINEDAENITLDTSERSLCYFNGKAYADGQFVCSGSQLLRCDRGLWFDEGSCDPNNP
jgi:hypothetical protein